MLEDNNANDNADSQTLGKNMHVWDTVLHSNMRIWTRVVVYTRTPPIK